MVALSYITKLDLSLLPQTNNPELLILLTHIHNAIFTLAQQIDTVLTLSEDIRIDSATHGLILKDTQATPHYWRITVSNVGVLIITDIGTSLP